MGSPCCGFLMKGFLRDVLLTRSTRSIIYALVCVGVRASFAVPVAMLGFALRSQDEGSCVRFHLNIIASSMLASPVAVYCPSRVPSARAPIVDAK